MARKSRALRQKQAKRQGIASGKQTAEHPQGSSTSVQGTVSTTVAPKTAELAPATAVVAELANKQAGSVLVDATPMQQRESAIVSDVPSEVALVQQSADSASAAPVAKEELVTPSANCATPSDSQKLDVVLEDPAAEPDDPSFVRVMPAVALDEPREPSMMAVGKLEQQSEDSVTLLSSSPLMDAAGVSEPLKSNTAAATAPEDPALEIDKPPLAPLPLAVDLDELTEPASAAHRPSQDPDLVDDVVASGPQEPHTADITTLEVPVPEVEEPPTALADDSAAKPEDRLVCARLEVATTITPQYNDETAAATVVVAAETLEGCVQPPQNQAAIASEVTAAAVSKAVEAASEVQAAVADEILEPPTTKKISKLEVQSDLPPSVADIPSPCRERVTPKYEARESSFTEDPRRDCWVMTTGAIWKFFFGGQQLQHQQQQQQQQQQQRCCTR